MNKKKLKPKQISRNWLIGVILIGLTLIGILVYRQLLNPSTIALVGEEETGPVKVCTSNIASFTTQGSCSNGNVQRVTYACKYDDKKGFEGNLGSCIDPQLAFQHAQTFCGQTCVEARTPMPSETSTPLSSPKSSPSIYPSPSIGEITQPAPSIRVSPTPSLSPSPSPVSSASGICPLSLSTWAYRISCGRDQFQFVDYTCAGDQKPRVLGTAGVCKAAATLSSEARSACATNRCITSTPTPTPVVRTTPSPTKQPLSLCYRTCRQSTTRSIWSCYSLCSGR